MLQLTLDTNCLIDVAEARAGAASVLALAKAHANGIADVAVVAIAASERQTDARQLQNFGEFETRLKALGLGHLKIIKPLGYWGITFWDRSLWGTAEGIAVERKIHNILFPTLPFDGDAFAEEEHDRRKWRNAKCDVQSYWAHVQQRRDVFVTSDENFHKQSKKPQLIELIGPEARIMRPDEAAAHP